MENLTKPGVLKRDTEKMLDVIAKLLMPILLLVLGTWFNYVTNSNQEKQRAQEQRIADEQSKSVLLESYIKHLTSSNPAERELALHILSLDTEQFNPQMVDLISAVAATGTPSERETALEALNHASHSNNPAVRQAASRNISSVPEIPVISTDPKDVQQKAAAINQVLGSAGVKTNGLNKVLDGLHILN
ncbi:MAG: hypothetical protein ACHQNE_07960 [Candidatus Kapaibacterium sp.]